MVKTSVYHSGHDQQGYGKRYPVNDTGPGRRHTCERQEKQQPGSERDTVRGHYQTRVKAPCVGGNPRMLAQILKVLRCLPCPARLQRRLLAAWASMSMPATAAPARASRTAFRGS